MFAFEIWGKFASFRDPFTISQNISFPLPPKTTVAGMMASILGVENYFKDDAFSNFEYSVVTVNPIRKKSFSQNYINDYTSKVQSHLNGLKKSDFEKVKSGFRDKKNPQKPINRELLLNPHYLVFIKGFKYQEKLEGYLKERVSKFPLYLGNSEFAGNFRWIEIIKEQEIELEGVDIDSFILAEDITNIDFKEGMRYSKISFATKLNNHRSPLVFGDVVVGSSAITIKKLKAYKIETQKRNYYCRFL